MSRRAYCPNCGQSVVPPCPRCDPQGTRFRAFQSSSVRLPSYDPTPEDIARACREIRARWSQTERRSRQVLVGAVPWGLPFCQVVAGSDD